MATAIDYDPNMSVLAARTRYFADNAFGSDGGYGSKWVTLAKLGPIPLGFPNTAARVRAVRLHDLHHLVTGYDTNFTGEAEIAAWELASGCERFPAAWLLNHLALPIGLWRASERMRKAYARGCKSKNLYDREYDDALLDERLGALRERLGVDEAVGATLTRAQLRRYRRTVAIGLSLQALVLALLGGALAVVVLAIMWLVG